MHLRHLLRPSPRHAVGMIFFLTGFAAALWAASVPFMKLRLALDDAQLGLAILAVGAGAVVAMPLASRVTAAFGSRRVLRLAGLLMPATLLPLTVVNSTSFLVALLFGFGVTSGLIEVAGNAQGIALEAAERRPLMSWIHAMFSVGGLIGASAIALALRAGLPLGGCVLAITSCMAAIALAAGPGLLAHAQAPQPAGLALRLPPARVLLLGLLCSFAFLAEGAVADWSGVFLRFTHGADPALAALGYAGLAIAMAAGRLTGDEIRRRVGAAWLLRLGGSLAAAGFLLAVTTPGIPLTLAGFALVGLGVANVIPVLMSTAGTVKNFAPDAAIALVAASGWAGFMAGPALIGLIAEGTSLAFALGGVAILMALVAASARVVQTRGLTASPATQGSP